MGGGIFLCNDGNNCRIVYRIFRFVRNIDFCRIFRFIELQMSFLFLFRHERYGENAFFCPDIT